MVLCGELLLIRKIFERLARGSLLGLTLGTAAAGTEHIGIELDGKSEYAVVRRPFLADLLIFEQLLRRLLDNLL